MKYTVTSASARLASGVLGLTKEQARARRHNLKDLGKGRYEILHPVEFKAGEVIAYEGDLPKAMAAVMIDEAEAKKDADKKAKAEAKAKAKEEAERAQRQAEAESIAADIATLEASLETASNQDEWDAIEQQIAAKKAELSALGE